MNDAAVSIAPEISTHTDSGWHVPDDAHAPAFDLDYGLGILADRTGGEGAGEVVSRIAANAILEFMEQRMSAFDWLAPGDPAIRMRTLMLGAIQHADRQMLQLAHKQQPQSGVLTTILMALFHTDQVIVAQVGNAHFYRMRAGSLKLLAHHTLPSQAQIDGGMLIVEAAPLAVYQNLLIPVSGLVEDTDICVHATQPGDLYLLCSAGISDLLSPEEIAALLWAYSDHPETARAALIARINDCCGHDHSSLTLVKLESTATQIRGFYGRIFSCHY